MGETRSSSTFSYAVFRYMKDAKREIAVPIGVALWSEDANWVGVRLINSDQKVPRISRKGDFPFIGVFERKLDSWLAGRHLPYQDQPVSPASDAWWKHLQKLLIHKTRISDPRPIDCLDPEKEIESLFREIVSPEETEDHARIDHLITQCLGGLSKTLRRGEINGYAGKPVEIMRCFLGREATVVVEGVNLALENAASEADALVGKLQRVRANGSIQPSADRRVIAIVGYVASENGLNGEAFLKDWIEKAGNATALDVQREGAKLRAETEQALTEAGPPPTFTYV